MYYDPNQNNNPESNSPPPDPGYGYPPPPPFPPYPGAGFYGPPAQPLPLDEAIKQLPAQYLRVLTKPGAAIFAQEKSKASWNIIWVQIAIIAIFNALILVAEHTWSPSTSLANLSTNANATSFMNVFQTLYWPINIGALVFSSIGTFITVGIYYLIAKAFKGQGTFLEQMYCYLLFDVPILIIARFVSLIPGVGSLVYLAVFIYTIVLQVYMTMAVHRMSGGKATLAVLLLPIIVMVLACGAIGIITVVVISASHNLR